MNIFSFFAGSFRLILFVSSVILLVLSLLMASQALIANDFYVMLGALDWSAKANWFLFSALYMSAVAVLGLLGTFYNHRGMIRLFGVLTAVNGLICLLILLGLPNQQSVNVRFEDIMYKSQTEYKWTFDVPLSPANKRDNILERNETTRPFPPPHPPQPHPHPHPDPNPDQELRDPTRMWDLLQRSYFCCGLYDKSEWYKYSPIDRALPKSCCLPHEQSTSTLAGITYCQEPGILWSGSCMERIAKPAKLIAYTLVGALILNLLFSTLAFIVTCCSTYDYQSSGYVREYPSQMIGNSLHDGCTEPHLIIANNMPPCHCPPPYIQSANLYPNLDEKKKQSANYGSFC